MTRTIRALDAVLVYTLEALAVTPALAVQPCPDSNACAHITVDSVSGMPGDNVPVGISFQQGADDGRDGGIDAIAALAMTISFAGGAGNNRLTLVDCSTDSTGLPKSMRPDSALSGFNVTVQNAYCTAARTHCLCPDLLSGITPDAFANVAIFAPRDRVAAALTAITPLPNGHLLSIDFRIGEEAGSSTPLHVFTSWTDDQHPPSTALVSLGDTLDVDQTCVPQPGATPCSGAGAVSQLTITDGVVNVTLLPTATNTLPGTPTLTPTPTEASTPTASATATPTASTTGIASPSPTSTSSDTPTQTSTATITPKPTDTNTPTPTTSSTPTTAASYTPSNTPTLVPTSTPTVVPPTVTPLLPTATETPFALPSPTVPPCSGDCNGDGKVTVDEILTMLDIALGNVSVSACPAGDLNLDGQITVDEILVAVARALNGC